MKGFVEPRGEVMQCLPATVVLQRALGSARPLTVQLPDQVASRLRWCVPSVPEVLRLSLYAQCLRDLTRIQRLPPRHAVLLGWGNTAPSRAPRSGRSTSGTPQLARYWACGTHLGVGEVLKAYPPSSARSDTSSTSSCTLSMPWSLYWHCQQRWLCRTPSPPPT